MRVRRRIKQVVFRRLLEKRPKLLSIVRSIQFKLWQAAMHFRRHLRRQRINENEIIFVNPSNIYRYVGNLPWNRYDMRGRTVGGDWDLSAQPFHKWDLHQAIEMHFKHDVPWQDTEFYKRVQSEVLAGAVKWGCSTIEDVDHRFERLDSLYKEIKTNGFKSQREIHASGEDKFAWENDSPFSQYDDVTICIDRYGRMLLRDGKHRMSMAKVLGLKQIPVVVGLRHSEWENFRTELEEWVASRNGFSYQPLTHPDLQRIRVQHDDGRFELMHDHLRSLRTKYKSVLDIGSFVGFFCHKFEELGYECTAVELHPKHLYFMKKLKEAEERSFKIVDKSVFDHEFTQDYDIVLALNIFHHFLKTPASLNRLRLFLRSLNTELMFFQPHCPDDYVAQNNYVNFGPDEFVNFVLENSCLSRVQKLGVVGRGRSLFALER